METNHYRVITACAKTTDFYEALQSISQKWQGLGVKKVKLFFAGFTDVYISITAKRWFELPDMNDEEFTGDAEDCIRDFSYLRCMLLSAKPRPERSWIGEWKEFLSSEMLSEFTNQKLAKLTG